MLILAGFLILGGALQLWAAIATATRKGELRVTQARQLEAAFGRRGAVVFFACSAALLFGVGIYLVARAG